MKKYDYYISLEGLNFDRFFSEINRLNVTIFDYSRPNYKNSLFGIRLLDYLKIKKLPFWSYFIKNCNIRGRFFQFL